MSVSSKVTLGALRLQAQQRADLENSQAVSTPEWNQYISQSRKELYDLLVAAYGNEYYMATPYVFNLNGAETFPLPADFYKLLGVDLQYSSSPTGWITLKRFELIERNKSQFPNTNASFLGYTALRYRLEGDNLAFNLVPASGQVARLLYIPEPTNLQWIPSCSTTLNSTTVSMPDVTGITVGMTVYGPSVQNLPLPTTVTAVDTTINTVTLSQPVLATQLYVTLAFWRDDTQVDGISGWEEYVVIDAAIKARIKQEQPVDDLRMQKAEMKMRIESMSEGRDAGQAHHISDVLGASSYGGGDGFSGGFGSEGW